MEDVSVVTVVAGSGFALGLIFGAVVFADAGITWGPRVGPDTDGVRVDGGLGLLFDLSRFSTNNVLRLEIAWPDDGGPYVISITGGALF